MGGVGGTAFPTGEWHTKWNSWRKTYVMLCGVKSISAWLKCRISVRKGKKRKMKLLRVKQVYRRPWIHYKEGKITSCHNLEDSSPYSLLLLLDSKPTLHGASNNWEPCPAEAVWSFKVSFASQKGHSPYSRQVNTLPRAYCMRTPAAYSYYVFTFNRYPQWSHQSSLITQDNKSPLAVLCHPGSGVTHHPYNIMTDSSCHPVGISKLDTGSIEQSQRPLHTRHRTVLREELINFRNS